MSLELLFLFGIAGAPKPDYCRSYAIEKLSRPKLEADLNEMSGLVRTDDGLLVHVQDSGNEPFLIMTKRDGTVTDRVRFSDVATDPEELARSGCPWDEGKSCIYAFDTGDNFRWRSERNIWAIEEASMRSEKPRIENLVFTFPRGERIDSEAAAIVGKTIYIFAKERKHARVFALDKSAWVKGDRVAMLVDDLPITMLTGAAAAKDGSRIMVLNWQGAFELSKDGGGTKADSAWYPYRRKIKILGLAQQEAIAYDDDQRSFLYTSEKRGYSKDDWGIFRGVCITQP